MGFFKSSMYSFILVIIIYMLYALILGMSDIILSTLFISFYVIIIGAVGLLIGEFVYWFCNFGKWLGGIVYASLGIVYSIGVTFILYSSYFDNMIYLLGVTGSISFYLFRSGLIALKNVL